MTKTVTSVCPALEFNESWATPTVSFPVAKIMFTDGIKNM